MKNRKEINNLYNELNKELNTYLNSSDYQNEDWVESVEKELAYLQGQVDILKIILKLNET